MGVVWLKWALGTILFAAAVVFGSLGAIKNWPRWSIALCALVIFALFVQLLLQLRERRAMNQEKKQAVPAEKSVGIRLNNIGRMVITDYETDADEVLDATNVTDGHVSKVRHKTRRQDGNVA